MYKVMRKNRKLRLSWSKKKCVGDNLFVVIVVGEYYVARKQLFVDAESNNSRDECHVAEGHPID